MQENKNLKLVGTWGLCSLEGRLFSDYFCEKSQNAMWTIALDIFMADVLPIAPRPLLETPGFYCLLIFSRISSTLPLPNNAAEKVLVTGRMTW